MADCLLALGANLGDRAAAMERALAAIALLPQTRLVARSRWHGTRPIGGPARQGRFLNGAVRLTTDLAPRELLENLRAIESSLGRERARERRWDARALDLDLVLYDELELAEEHLAIPHPRMVWRRFVLEPACEVAPGRIHPDSGWTLQRLLEHLDRGANLIAVAAVDPLQAEQIVQQLAARTNLPAIFNDPAAVLVLGKTFIAPWAPGLHAALSRNAARFPKLLLAVTPAGTKTADCRRILRLPSTGPVAWLPRPTDPTCLEDAMAAIEAVWPKFLGVEGLNA